MRRPFKYLANNILSTESDVKRGVLLTVDRPLQKLTSQIK